jgi:hypothetical protein
MLTQEELVWLAKQLASVVMVVVITLACAGAIIFAIAVIAKLVSDQITQ